MSEEDEETWHSVSIEEIKDTFEDRVVNAIADNASALKNYALEGLSNTDSYLDGEDAEITSIIDTAFSGTLNQTYWLIVRSYVLFYDIMVDKINYELSGTDIPQRWTQVVTDILKERKAHEQDPEKKDTPYNISNDLDDRWNTLVHEKNAFVHKRVTSEIDVNFSERFAPLIMVANIPKVYTSTHGDTIETDVENALFDRFLPQVFHHTNLFQIGLLGFISEDEIASVIFGGDMDWVNDFDPNNPFDSIRNIQGVSMDGCRMLILSVYITWLLYLRGKDAEITKLDEHTLRDPTSPINEALVTVLIPVLFAAIGSIMMSVGGEYGGMSIGRLPQGQLWHTPTSGLNVFPSFHFVNEDGAHAPPIINEGKESEYDKILGDHNHSVRSNVMAKMLKHFRSFPMMEPSDVRMVEEKEQVVFDLSDHVETAIGSRERIEERNKYLFSFFSGLASYHTPTKWMRKRQEIGIYRILLGKKWVEPGRYKQWVKDRSVHDHFWPSPPAENNKTLQIAFGPELKEGEGPAPVSPETSLELTFDLQRQEEQQKQKEEEEARKREEKALLEARAQERKAHTARLEAEDAEKERKKAEKKKRETKELLKQERERERERERLRKEEEQRQEQERLRKEEEQRQEQERLRKEKKEQERLRREKAEAEAEAERKRREKAKGKTKPLVSPTPGSSLVDIERYHQDLRDRGEVVEMTAKEHKAFLDEIDQYKDDLEKCQNELKDVHGLAVRGRIYRVIVDWMSTKEMSSKIEVIESTTKGIDMLVRAAVQLNYSPKRTHNDKFEELVRTTAIATEEYPNTKEEAVDRYENDVRDTYGFDANKLKTFLSAKGGIPKIGLSGSRIDGTAKPKPTESSGGLPHNLCYTKEMKESVHKALSEYDTAQRIEHLSTRDVSQDTKLSGGDYVDDGETECDEEVSSFRESSASASPLVRNFRNLPKRAKTSLFDHASRVSTQAFTHMHSKDDPTRNRLMARIESRFREKYHKAQVRREKGCDDARTKKVYDLYDNHECADTQMTTTTAMTNESVKYSKGLGGIGTTLGSVPMYHYGACSPPMSKKLSTFMKSRKRVFPEDQAKESITNLVGCSLAIVSTSVCNRVSVTDIIYEEHERFMETTRKERWKPTTSPRRVEDKAVMQRKLGSSLASRDRFDSSCRSTNSNKRICPGIFQRIIRKWEDLVLIVHGISNGEEEELLESLRGLISKNVSSMIVAIMDNDVSISKGNMYNLCKLADFPEGLRVTMANIVEEMHSCVEEFRFSKTERRTAMKDLVKRVHDIHISDH